MKNIKCVLLLCAALLYKDSLFAQTSPQQNTVKLFFEKVFVHTDRSLYAPGEDIWFKAYVVNAQDNHLIGTSKNLYVELIAPADTIVNKEIILLDKGTGKGDFALSTKLPAGNYRLRAYTNWMRNFGNNFIYEKNITITGNAESNKNTATVKQVSQTQGKNQPQVTAANAIDVSFFPEGGSLISNITSIVAVKAEDAQGNGIAANGQVLSATGDTVAKFSCDSLGMGLFAMLPLTGQTYKGTITYKGQAATVSLPAALSSGLSLKVTKKDTLIYITISCNDATFAGKTLTLSARHAGNVVVDQQLQLKDNQVILKLPESILPQGISALTLYDDQHKPNCERLIYVEHTNHTAKLTIGIDKNTFKSREKVAVNIGATEGNKLVSGNYSMAVVDAGLNPVESANITDYLLLQSEINGKIEHAERYFDTTNINRAKQLDMLLLTQGWRDFVWKKLVETPIHISYLPEQGFTLNGKVKKETNNAPVGASNITLSVPKATGQKLFFAQTDAGGNYYIDNLQLFGRQNVRVSTRDAKGKSNGLISLDSLSAHSLPVNKSEAPVHATTTISNAIATEIARRVPINRLLDSVTNLKEVKINANRTVRLRDQTAITAGYKDEVLTVTKDDLSFRNLRAYILYASKQAKPDPNPLATGNQIIFYLNGHPSKPRIIVNNEEVPFTDMDDDVILDHYYDTYYSLPMTVVEKVVIKHLISGLKSGTTDGSRANGVSNSVAGIKAVPTGDIFVIYLTLKPGALLRNSGGITTANIQGYYETRTFYKPIHTGTDSQKPDLRNTIHWEPLIKTDANGKATVTFYNADPKTNIRIMVQGVTDTGEPVSAVKSYAVK